MSKAPVATVVAVAALAFTASAYGHAGMSPAVAKTTAGQEFTLTVPTEKEGVTTTTIELTPPDGFSIFSFEDSPGWKRVEAATGSGEERKITKVTWSGGHVPTEHLAVFRFVGSLDSAKSYAVKVRQTYSNGEIVDWSGPESSDTPAPVVEGVSSFGGDSSSTLTIVALIVGGIGVLLGIVGLTTRGRPLA
jgi:uncharacterized protein YcnI